jgi:hypothetical protein
MAGVSVNVADVAFIDAGTPEYSITLATFGGELMQRF